VDILAAASTAGRHVADLAAEGDAALFQINLFWVIVSALNFILFFVLIWSFAFKPVTAMLSERKSKIEQGLKDAEQARRDRENAEQERTAALSEARREANEILARAQKVAQDTRDADIAATREELERLRVRAAAEIEAEKTRAVQEVRAEGRSSTRPRPSSLMSASVGYWPTRPFRWSGGSRWRRRSSANRSTSPSST
jgi:F-type H+-transporting ATPase subunit b